MTNTFITIGVLIGGLLLFIVVGLIFAWYKRQGYLKDIRGKMKGIFFSDGAEYPIVEILDIMPSGVEVRAPIGHHCGTYYINRESSWSTMYPEKPFLGLWFVQVPIKTHYWSVDNPEPLTGYKHREVATPAQIFASNDNAFMFAFRQAKAELEADRKEILKLTKNQLNKTYIYAGLIVASIGGAGSVFLIYKYGETITNIAKSLGVN